MRSVSRNWSAQYLESIASFKKAIQRAPFWIYPRHNLAIAHAEQGEYSIAEGEFGPRYTLSSTRAHLHYSLGLLYQRLGRARDARKEYQAALCAEGSGRTTTAIGSLLADAGKTEDAAREYRRAITLNPGMLAARHDLAVLLSKKDAAGAIDLWEENIKRDPKFAPSRLSLARALRNVPDRLADSAAQYRELLKSRPNLFGARVEFAEVLERLNNGIESRAEMEFAANAETRNFSIREKLADLLARQEDIAAAEREYGAALALATDRSSRKRIRAKLRGLRGAAPRQ